MGNQKKKAGRVATNFNDSLNSTAKKAPKAIINTLRDAVVGVIREPHNSEQLENWGLTPVGGTPDEFGAFLKKEIAKYQRIVREAKIARS